MSRICALVYAGTDDMLTGNPDLEEVLAFERGSGVGRIRNEGRLVSQLRKIRPAVAGEGGGGGVAGGWGGGWVGGAVGGGGGGGGVWSGLFVFSFFPGRVARGGPGP